MYKKEIARIEAAGRPDAGGFHSKAAFASGQALTLLP